jgi:hypothetical protein
VLESDVSITTVVLLLSGILIEHVGEGKTRDISIYSTVALALPSTLPLDLPPLFADGDGFPGKR